MGCMVHYGRRRTIVEDEKGSPERGGRGIRGVDMHTNKVHN